MGKKLLYLECATGIAGDMMVASLVGCGASPVKIQQALDSLKLPGMSVTFGKTVSHGMAADTFRVHCGYPEHEHEHDHDHEHEHEDEHEHEHEHDHDHEHEHEHHHDHEHHHHEHRHLAEIREILSRGELSDTARALALKIFGIVAEAEAKAHGVPVEEVHFHEVGAIDSIADIVATAVALDDLKVDGCVVVGLTDGCGTIRCAHGDLPVPVPAVANIAAAYRLPLRSTAIPTELVTPTGAAIVAALRTQSTMPSHYQICGMGQGAGEREIGRPNVLRTMLLEELEDAPAADGVWVLETNLDDATGEQLAFTQELLLEHGARDVFFVPVTMKKSRPGWMLQVICDEAKISLMEEIVFANTTTIGIRRHFCQRVCLPREIVTVSTKWGEARVKVVSLPDGAKRGYPEYESVRQLSKASGSGFQDVYEAIRRQIQE